MICADIQCCVLKLDRIRALNVTYTKKNFAYLESVDILYGACYDVKERHYMVFPIATRFGLDHLCVRYWCGLGEFSHYPRPAFVAHPSTCIMSTGFLQEVLLRRRRRRRFHGFNHPSPYLRTRVKMEYCYTSISLPVLHGLFYGEFEFHRRQNSSVESNSFFKEI